MRDGKENARSDGRTSEQAVEGWSETVSYHSHSSAQRAAVKPYDCFLPSANSTRNGGGGQDIFAAVKERVSMTEAANFYGYPPNRSGFICCPFHGEKTPSCRLWDDHFYCFGCHMGGSVVDFTAHLFGLSPLESVKRLNADFSVGLTLDGRKPTAAELEAARRRRDVRETLKAFEAWREGANDLVSCAIGVGNDALIHRTPEQWTETELDAIREKARLESFIDDLESGDDEKQLSSLRDWREVYGIAIRICRGQFSGNP